MNHNLKEAFDIAYDRYMYTQLVCRAVTKPNDGASPVRRKNRPGRKRVDDDKAVQQQHQKP